MDLARFRHSPIIDSALPNRESRRRQIDLENNNDDSVGLEADIIGTKLRLFYN